MQWHSYGAIEAPFVVQVRSWPNFVFVPTVPVPTLRLAFLPRFLSIPQFLLVMTAPSSSADSPDPFASGSAFDEEADAGEAGDVPPWEEQRGDSIDQGSIDEFSPSFATEMARMWVKRHQKASMLGAFAVGVFAGAMLRE